MASQGPNFPSGATSVDGSGSDPAGWENLTNVYTENSTGTVNNAATTNFGLSDKLHTSTYSFAIPSGATINGIVVEVRSKKDYVSSNAASDVNVYLLKAGSIVGSNKGLNTDVTTSFTYRTYGSSSDLWGTTWTDSEINASNFGVSYQMDLQQCCAKFTPPYYVDTIRITVHYTEGGGGPTSASALLLAGD